MKQNITRRDFIRRLLLAGAAVPLLNLISCIDQTEYNINLRRIDELNEKAIKDFIGLFRGQVIRPQDKIYDQARRVFNARFDKWPGLIVKPLDVNDVAATVRFANEENIILAVRGGGHSYAGYSVCDGGMVIDLSGMKKLEINPENSTVRTQLGYVTRELDYATQAKGMALVLSETATVGVSGLILGGGLAWLNSRFGTACDNLLSAQIVLADGQIVTANSTENPDLFFALKGGGGNFGIATEFTLRAHPMTRVVAGELLFDQDQAHTVSKNYKDFLITAPDELQTLVQFIPTPNRTSKASMAIKVCYSESLDKAEPWLKKLRGLGKSYADTIQEKSYLDFQGSHAVAPPGLSNSIRSGFFPTLEDDMIDAFTELIVKAPQISLLGGLHWHGAPCRIPLDAAAFPLREPGFNFLVTALWNDPAQQDTCIGWVEEVWNAVAPYTIGAYSNLMEDEGAKRVLEAYGKNYSRLVKLKRKYDPKNLFRLNQNINPAA